MDSRRGIYSIIALILFCFLGCNEDDDIVKKDEINLNGEIPENVLIPLKTGNKWIYQKRYGYNMEVLDTTEFSIGEEVLVNEIKAFEFSSEKEAPFHGRFFVCTDSKGNHLKIGGYSITDTLISPNVLFKYNANSGDSWSTNIIHIAQMDGMFSETPVEVKCITTDTLITTEKGEFNCRLYEETLTTIYDEYITKTFIAENIGRVRMEAWNNGQPFIFYDLLDYMLFE